VVAPRFHSNGVHMVWQTTQQALLNLLTIWFRHGALREVSPLHHGCICSSAQQGLKHFKSCMVQLDLLNLLTIWFRHGALPEVVFLEV
jgi:hypothetical protein